MIVVQPQVAEEDWRASRPSSSCIRRGWRNTPIIRKYISVDHLVLNKKEEDKDNRGCWILWSEPKEVLISYPSYNLLRNRNRIIINYSNQGAKSNSEIIFMLLINHLQNLEGVKMKMKELIIIMIQISKMLDRVLKSKHR